MRTVFLGEDGVCAGEEQATRVQSAVAASLLVARGSLRTTGGGGGDGVVEAVGGDVNERVVTSAERFERFFGAGLSQAHERRYVLLHEEFSDLFRLGERAGQIAVAAAGEERVGRFEGSEVKRLIVCKTGDETLFLFPFAPFAESDEGGEVGVVVQPAEDGGTVKRVLLTAFLAKTRCRGEAVTSIKVTHDLCAVKGQAFNGELMQQAGGGEIDAADVGHIVQDGLPDEACEKRVPIDCIQTFMRFHGGKEVCVAVAQFSEVVVAEENAHDGARSVFSEHEGCVGLPQPTDVERDKFHGEVVFGERSSHVAPTGAEIRHEVTIFLASDHEFLFQLLRFCLNGSKTFGGL